MATPTNFWKSKLLEILMLIYVFAGRANGYGTGAPPTQCVSMTPGHGVAAQGGTSPFSITTDKSTYSAGVPIEVTINGPAFKGFLLEARDKNDAVVGKFASPPANTKLIKCTNVNDAMTHSNKNPKDDPVFTWTPPNNDVGDVTFTATVVIAYATIWKNNKSPPVKYMAPTTTTQSTPTTTTATTKATTVTTKATTKATTVTTKAATSKPMAVTTKGDGTVATTMVSGTTTGDMMNGTTGNMTSSGRGETRAKNSYSMLIYAILTVLLITFQPIF